MTDCHECDARVSNSWGSIENIGHKRFLSIQSIFTALVANGSTITQDTCVATFSWVFSSSLSLKGIGLT